jgi:BlaI family transcriptional regulator, penicillinase repressor
MIAAFFAVKSRIDKKISEISKFFLDVFYICRICSNSIEFGVRDMPKSKKAASRRKEKTSVELTEAEWEIMKIVWEKEPCAAGTVQETLAGSRSRAYSTVKTTMDRMVEKGFLEIERIRNLQLFKSRVSEVDARRGEFRRMLKRAFDGALTPMMQFLIEHEGLSKEEAARLRVLVRKLNKEGGRKEKARNEPSNHYFGGDS